MTGRYLRVPRDCWALGAGNPERTWRMRQLLPAPRWSGRPILASRPVKEAETNKVTTIEGLAEHPDQPVHRASSAARWNGNGVNDGGTIDGERVVDRSLNLKLNRFIRLSVLDHRSDLGAGTASRNR